MVETQLPSFLRMTFHHGLYYCDTSSPRALLYLEGTCVDKTDVLKLISVICNNE
jgi:hypothetical protein